MMLLEDNERFVCSECGYTIYIQDQYEGKDEDITDLVRGVCHG